MTIEPAVVNSMPGFLVYSAGVLDMVLHLEIDDHLITGVYVVRNPDKLTHLRARPDASDQT